MFAVCGAKASHHTDCGEFRDFTEKKRQRAAFFLRNPEKNRMPLHPRWKCSNTLIETCLNLSFNLRIFLGAPAALPGTPATPAFHSAEALACNAAGIACQRPGSALPGRRSTAGSRTRNRSFKNHNVATVPDRNEFRIRNELKWFFSPVPHNVQYSTYRGGWIELNWIMIE